MLSIIIIVMHELATDTMSRPTTVTDAKMSQLMRNESSSIGSQVKETVFINCLIPLQADAD